MGAYAIRDRSQEGVSKLAASAEVVILKGKYAYLRAIQDSALKHLASDSYHTSSSGL